MYILHLIIKDYCKHTVCVEFRKGETAITDAKKKLISEAKGEACEIIFCNDEGMPFKFEPVAGDNAENEHVHTIAVCLCVVIIVAAFTGIL
tara:strand:+ start:594 stop:866 length:273 start_codon:yes stop_codon:yes gene_type:complete